MCVEMFFVLILEIARKKYQSLECLKILIEVCKLKIRSFAKKIKRCFCVFIVVISLVKRQTKVSSSGPSAK